MSFTDRQLGQRIHSEPQTVYQCSTRKRIAGYDMMDLLKQGDVLIVTKDDAPGNIIDWWTQWDIPAHIKKLPRRTHMEIVRRMVPDFGPTSLSAEGKKGVTCIETRRLVEPGWSGEVWRHSSMDELDASGRDRIRNHLEHIMCVVEAKTGDDMYDLSGAIRSSDVLNRIIRSVPFLNKAIRDDKGGFFCSELVIMLLRLLEIYVSGREGSKYRGYQFDPCASMEASKVSPIEGAYEFRQSKVWKKKFKWGVHSG